MQFLGNLGIDIKLLIAQIINFGLLLWILTKLLYRPIIKRIEEDENELKKARTQQDELAKDQKALEFQRKQEISDAKRRSREIIEEAEKIALELKERSSQEAEREKEAIIKQAKSRLAEIENAPNSKSQ